MFYILHAVFNIVIAICSCCWLYFIALLLRHRAEEDWTDLLLYCMSLECVILSEGHGMLLSTTSYAAVIGQVSVRNIKQRVVVSSDVYLF